MLTRGKEFDLRPFLHGHIQINPRRRDIGKVTGMIEGQVGRLACLELRQLLVIIAFDPARSSDIDRFEIAVDAVLMPDFQSPIVVKEWTRRP